MIATIGYLNSHIVQIVFFAGTVEHSPSPSIAFSYILRPAMGTEYAAAISPGSNLRRSRTHSPLHRFPIAIDKLKLLRAGPGAILRVGSKGYCSEVASGGLLHVLSRDAYSFIDLSCRSHC